MEQKAVKSKQGQFMRLMASACVFATFVGVSIHPAIAQTDGAMTIRFGGTETEGGFVLMDLIVPDQNPTRSSADGQMRPYDLHIAKMFEVTDFLCQQLSAGESLKGYEWLYRGANGKSSLGRYRISCALARNLATAYGLGKTQRTEIGRESEGGPPEVDVHAIPRFNITGPKVQKWTDFVKKFPSVDKR